MKLFAWGNLFSNYEIIIESLYLSFTSSEFLSNFERIFYVESLNNPNLNYSINLKKISNH